MENEVLTPKEAADFLKISLPTLYQLKARNKIPFGKVGGQLRFIKSELVEWVKKAK
jgi:excisionase family DNA binding protein